jgi:Ca2+-binding RTX toxin-like protein
MPDPIYAGTGTTTGTSGSDLIYGTPGNDNIYGRDGDDIIIAHEGADSTRGEGGADSLYGGSGNDLLDGGTGADYMEGGADNDTYIVDSAADAVVEAAGEGTDTVRSLVASYTLPDNVEILDLMFGAGVTGIGNGLDNSIRGNALGNALYGLDGSDRVNGEGGDDLIVGGAGALDLLLGGTGADRFEFAAADSSAANAADNIGDLNFGDGDTIALLGLGAGGSDVVLGSYQDVYEFVRDTPGVSAATGSSGRLFLTIPNGTSTQVINITDPTAWSQFQAANPDPVANDDTATTDEDTSVLVDVLGNDTDDTPLTLVTATAPAGQGTVTIEGGQVRFDPGSDFDYLAIGESADVTVTYQVSDQFGKTDTATLTVTVTGLDEGPVSLPDECAHSNDPNNNDAFGGGSLFNALSQSQLNQNNTLRGTSGGDSIDAKAGNDTVYAKAGDDAVDGGQGNDTIYAGSGNDGVDGGQGDDRLFGGSGRDIIDGGQGNDTILGGFGADFLTGGQGADTFVFLGQCDTNDTISDFSKGSDRLDLSQFKVNGTAYDFSAPVNAGVFATGQDLIWYHQDGDTFVLGNTDGDFSDAEFMIRLDGIVNLGASDFVL